MCKVDILLLLNCSTNDFSRRLDSLMEWRRTRLTLPLPVIDDAVKIGILR
jgi:hypothetical protein